MKKVLTTLFLITTTTLLGQSFGSIGSNWYYSEDEGGTAPPNTAYRHLKSVADTTIKGVTTHKIVSTWYTHKGDTIVTGSVYVYENSDTVFIYNFKKDKFQTIYIFKGSQGDTLTLDILQSLSGRTDSVYQVLIEKVETIIVDGFPLKKFHVIPLDPINFPGAENYYLSRIGGLNWFIPIIPYPSVPESGGPIRCYSDNQIDTNFQKVACDYRLKVSINETKIGPGLTIFPNPVHTILSIHSRETITRIEIKSIIGELLHTTNELQLNCEIFRNGIYILTVFFESGERVEKKIIVNAP